MGTFKLEEKAGTISRAVHEQLLDDHEKRIIAGDNVEELQAFGVPAASRQLRGRGHREGQLCNASRQKPTEAGANVTNRFQYGRGTGTDLGIGFVEAAPK
jgi:hypothetical protein